MRSFCFRHFIFVGALPLIACGMAPAANAQSCSTSLTVNLTVELESEKEADVLIELRQGVVGHSKVLNSQKFHGRTGTVFFSNLCAGSYFMDIGNGPRVVVTPAHEFGGNGRYQSTIRVTFSKGNVDKRNRSEL